MKTSKLISGIVSALLVATSLPAALPSSAAGETYRLNGAGQHKGTGPDGYSYEIWAADTSQPSSMTLGKNGAFSTEWNCAGPQGNFLARRGIDMGSTKTYQQYGSIECDFDVDWSAGSSGNSRICIYGWTQNPLVEYYIVEDWKNWCPPNGSPGAGSPLGNFTLDGAKYYIYKENRNSYTIEGNKPFVQYFSVRSSGRTKGTISVSKHFEAWEAKGLQMGKMYEVAFNVEGWESSGRATVNKNTMYLNGIPYGKDSTDDDPRPITTTTPTVTPTVEPDANGYYFSTDFESGRGSWEGRGNVTLTSSTGYNNTKGILVSDRSSEWNGAAIELDPNAFNAGETYSFGVMAMQNTDSSATMKLSLQYSGSSGTVYDEVATAKASKGQWVSVANPSYTIPAGATDLLLYIETTDSLADLYVDNAFAAKSGTKPSVVPSTSTPVTSTSDPVVSKTDKIKIMPAGDSITFGMGDDGGYRKFLDYFLKEKGYTNVDFVGPEGSNSASFSYNGKTVTYDDNHAGYSGYTIKQHAGGWSNNSGLYETLKNNDAVKKADPDIILLIIGTNDMTANRSMSECEDDLHTLLDYMLGDMSSDGMIFLSTIPELSAFGGGDNTQKIANYNSLVKKVAQEYSNSGKHVTFADIHGCLNGTADLGDGIHPNKTGYEKMGKYWAGVIDEYISASSDPAVQPSTGIRGDTNQDGVVDVFDLIPLRKGIMAVMAGSGKAAPNSDVNGDNDVSIADLVTLKQFLLGKIDKFPEAAVTTTTTAPRVTTTTTTKPVSQGQNLNAQIRQDMTTSVPSGNEQSNKCKVEKKTYNCKFTGGQKSCNVILPPNYNSSKQYPVMYVLHGIGGNEDSMVSGMGVQELLAGLISNGKAEEMIIVLPSQYTSKNGSQGGGFGINQEVCEAYDNFLYDISDSLIPFIEANYPVKTGRENRAITGVSLGGREAIYIGLMRPDLFAYVGGACPAPGITPGSDMFMTHPGCMQESEMKFRDVGPEPNVFFITGGTNDSVVGTFPKQYSDILTRNGVDHVYQSIPGGGHGDNSVKPHLYTFFRYAFK